MRTTKATQLALIILAVLLAFSTPSTLAETPKRGGILTFVVSAEPPSYDGHRESSFTILHWTRPFYSVLIRENPENPASPTDFVGVAEC